MANRHRMGLILDREQLCGALGVADSTIGLWETKGLPTERRGRGRGMKSLYDLDKVRAWCAKTGYGHSTSALLARFARAEPPPAPSGPAPAPVQTSALDEDQREALALAPAIEVALLAVPAVLAELEAPPGLAAAVVEKLLERLAQELVERRDVEPELAAVLAGRIRGMLAEELEQPGSWTT